MINLKIYPRLNIQYKRSVSNFFVNTLCGITAYVRQPKKPRIKLLDKKSLDLIAR